MQLIERIQGRLLWLCLMAMTLAGPSANAAGKEQTAAPADPGEAAAFAPLAASDELASIWNDPDFHVV